MSGAGRVLAAALLLAPGLALHAVASDAPESAPTAVARPMIAAPAVAERTTGAEGTAAMAAVDTAQPMTTPTTPRKTSGDGLPLAARGPMVGDAPRSAPAIAVPATAEPATTGPATTGPAITEPAGMEPVITEPATAGTAATRPAATVAPATGAASGAAPGPATAPAGDESPEPFELARSLHALQNQLAIGSRAALAAQRTVLTGLGARLLAADPDAWARPVNARAAIGYVLSGGQPQVLRALLDDGALPEPEATLAGAVLAYATGQRGDALAGLRAADARAVTPLLGAHLALAQGTIAMETDPQQAIDHLETARLLAPGTLIEESALRRQIVIASAIADADSFTFLVRQYTRRFPHSIYAAGFLQAFPDLWGGLGLTDDAGAFGRLSETLSGLDAATRRGIYLLLARRNALVGDRDLALFAAGRAAGLSSPGSADAVRARLYAASAGIVGPDAASAAATLRTIDPATLSARDADLHAAALAVADQVLLPAGTASGPASAPDDPAPSPVIARAQAAIEAADAMLRRTR